jgi:hypothetical protein
MIRIAIVAATILMATPGAAQTAPVEPAPLTLQQTTALRCSAAFAIGAALQGRGIATDWPPLATRGREFFVRASAQVMDETGRSRDAVASTIAEYARPLAAERAVLDAAMPPCLLLLDASGV